MPASYFVLGMESSPIVLVDRYRGDAIAVIGDDVEAGVDFLFLPAPSSTKDFAAQLERVGGPPDFRPAAPCGRMVPPTGATAFAHWLRLKCRCHLCQKLLRSFRVPAYGWSGTVFPRRWIGDDIDEFDSEVGDCVKSNWTDDDIATFRGRFFGSTAWDDETDARIDPVLRRR